MPVNVCFHPKRSFNSSKSVGFERQLSATSGRIERGVLKNEVPDENLLGTGIQFFKKLVKPRVVPQIVKKRIGLRARQPLVM